MLEMLVHYNFIYLYDISATPIAGLPALEPRLAVDAACWILEQHEREIMASIHSMRVIEVGVMGLRGQ